MIQDAFVALDFETANGKRTSICSLSGQWLKSLIVK